VIGAMLLAISQSSVGTRHSTYAKCRGQSIATINIPYIGTFLTFTPVPSYTGWARSKPLLIYQ